MKILSGNITTKIPFLAIEDTAPFTERLTGLNSFTVYRSRNGNPTAAFTSPTVAEADATNQPGLYWLLIDEDTTLDSGYIEQQMVVTISHAGMYPVDMVINIDDFGNRIPAALDEGFMKASTKRVGLTTLTPAGAGGQKYGG